MRRCRMDNYMAERIVKRRKLITEPERARDSGYFVDHLDRLRGNQIKDIEKLRLVNRLVVDSEVAVREMDEYAFGIDDKKRAKQNMSSSFEKLWYLVDEHDEEETYVFNMNEFPATQIHNNLSSKSVRTHESLYSTLNEKYDAIACDFSSELEFLLAYESHTVVPVYSLDTL
ncbi:hypothetical protein Tco_1070224 [Tanacetum coccineum]|uniref:Uncharacterized protein n=1 Tax=Tanacetum coccineum TaxID=301880 RepID=A0ABQ5HMK0_9ASTR